jgi:hypothetical protein
MEELMDVTFESGRLPDGWLAQERRHGFERGALRSGGATLLDIPLPEGSWRRWRVEAEVEPLEGATVVCSDHLYSLVTDLKRGTHRIAFYSMASLTTAEKPVPDSPARHRVVFELGDGPLRVLVDGQEVVAAEDPQPAPPGGLVRLEFWDDCLVHRVRVSGERAAVASSPLPARRSQADLWLEVNVDLPDDLLYAAFDRSMFDQMFAEFRRWGVRRCHWIYYGGVRNGWWNSCVRDISDRNYQRTVENVGDDFAAAVRTAHAHGIELHGLIKPFDMGFFESYGEGTAGARTKGKLDRIGGPIGWIADFPAQHRELMMSRQPGVFGPAENEVFTRIDLVKGDDSPAVFTVNDLQLWVSDDNATYRPHDGEITREEVVEDYPVWEHTSSGGRRTGESRRSRVMRLGGLSLKCKYFALTIDSRACSFVNDLINLVHVFGEQGEERRLTYGVMRREADITVEHAWIVDHNPDFWKSGIEFDRFPGTPSAVFPGFDAIRARHALDGGDGVLAIARGKDRDPVAMLSPAFPEVRQWWLSWVRDCLEAGADGVELRVRNHHSPHAWAEFGFEQPIVDAFRERYGVDLLSTDDFDKAAWRRLRGEAYTEFYREARQLAQSYGKPLGLHISPTLAMAPDQGAPMEIHCDWRRWLEEGLADSITMKEIWPRTRLAEEVMAYTRPRGLPVVFCPYANNLWNVAGGEAVVADWIRLAREGGFDGYQFYECSAVVRATPEGRIVMEQPALAELLSREFAR